MVFFGCVGVLEEVLANASRGVTGLHSTLGCRLQPNQLGYVGGVEAFVELSEAVTLLPVLRPSLCDVDTD